MVDVHSKKQRSYNMSRVKNKNTSLEVNFRKELFNTGLRGYRVNYKIKGKPDIVFTKRKVAIFLDGCFWHKCPECFSLPKTNKKFWKDKINGNVKRDKIVSETLKKDGYTVIRFWQHEIQKNSKVCLEKIRRKLTVTEKF